jgi:lipid A 4'-phosphatase
MRSSTVVLLLILSAAAVMAIVSLLAPGLDLDLARLAYDPVTHKFPAASNPTLVWLRDHDSIFVIIGVIAMVGALLLKLAVPRRPMLIPGRAIVFMTISLAIGPGFFINGIFKSHWGRPRPVEVTEFGGAQTFVPWWDDKGTCKHNCSFASGEAGTAAWLFAPAVLLPPPWRAAAFGGAAIVTVGVGALRIALGGHFLTDVVFGALMTIITIWLAHGLIYQWPRTRLSEQAIDRGLSSFAFRLRQWAAKMTGRKKR